MTPVRIGLAGYGRGGRYFHAPLIGLAPECTLAAVVTRNPRRRAELAQDFPGVPAVDSLGDLAAAGAGAVVITTPLDTHEALVREALALALPVVCDKPFTPDAPSARALIEAAPPSPGPSAARARCRWTRETRSPRSRSWTPPGPAPPAGRWSSSARGRRPRPRPFPRPRPP